MFLQIVVLSGRRTQWLDRKETIGYRRNSWDIGHRKYSRVFVHVQQRCRSCMFIYVCVCECAALGGGRVVTLKRS